MLFVLPGQTDAVDVWREFDSLAQRDQCNVVVQVGSVEFLVRANVLHPVIGVREEFVRGLGVLGEIKCLLYSMPFR